MQIPFLPFKILALAPFGPAAQTGANPRPIPVDLATIDEAFQAVSPRFHLPVDRELCPEAGLTLEFKSLKDFKPDRLIQNNEYLHQVAEAGRYAGEARSKGVSARDAVEHIRQAWPAVPVDPAALPAESEAKAASRVDDILSLVAMPGGGGGDARGTASLTGQLDSLLSSLLEAVYNNEEFRKYEAAWRGLEVLLKQAPIKEGGPVKVAIASVHPDTLAETLDALIADLALDLPGLVLIDAPMDSGVRSTELTQAAADFADNLLAPTAVWVSADFFHIAHWRDLGKVSYLKHHLEDASYAKWRKLAEQPGGNWLTAVCNRFVVRAPYGGDNKPKTASFEEIGPLWIAPVWALGTLVAQSVLECGWPSRLTDYVNVALHDLPVIDRPGDGPGVVEMDLSEDRLMEFVEIGLTPLYGPVRKDRAFMPKEVTLAGGSLKYQLFTARILAFLFWCKDNLDEAVRVGDLALNVQSAIAMFWERTGHPAPADLDVRAGEAEGGGPIPLNISMTPPAAVLPGGHKLELGFAW